MPEILQQPQEPDDLARLAGKDIYGTSVGILRRTELYRLGNMWGFKFPVGASKDYMLPFFIKLEAEGKNPLRPPTGSIDEVRKRQCDFNGENHSEVVEPEEEAHVPADTIQPAEKTEFELKLEALPHGQLKKMCKMKGITHARSDRKPDLVAKIVAAANGLA